MSQWLDVEVMYLFMLMCVFFAVVVYVRIHDGVVLYSFVVVYVFMLVAAVYLLFMLWCSVCVFMLAVVAYLFKLGVAVRACCDSFIHIFCCVFMYEWWCDFSWSERW